MADADSDVETSGDEAGGPKRARGARGTVAVRGTVRKAAKSEALDSDGDAAMGLGADEVH